MAFHPYPQVIRAVFNPQRFGPPRPVTAASPCSRVDRHGFGSTAGNIVALFRLAFALAPALKALTTLPTSNSPGHNAKGTPSEDTAPKCRASSDRLLAHGFRICFTRHLAFFSPFPHGTGALSVTEECLALEGGPPSFPQDCTCPAVLGIPLGVVDVDLPGFHRLWRAIPGRFGLVSYSHVAVPQPRRSKLRRFGLSPVRSPLLGGSRLLSLPPGTEMFHFPGFARLAT